jgi:hypothetical protein
MKLRFIKEEVEGKLKNKNQTFDLEDYRVNVISFIFNELEIALVFTGTYMSDNKNLLRFKPREGIHYPLEVSIESKSDNYNSEEYCKDVQNIIDNRTEEILKGLVNYHKSKISIAQDKIIIEQDNLCKAQKNYDKLTEYYAKELLFI